VCYRVKGIKEEGGMARDREVTGTEEKSRSRFLGKE
jgi:hypothetical protein